LNQGGINDEEFVVDEKLCRQLYYMAMTIQKG